jgi:hypothetical protein
MRAVRTWFGIPGFVPRLSLKSLLRTALIEVTGGNSMSKKFIIPSFTRYSERILRI